MKRFHKIYDAKEESQLIENGLDTTCEAILATMGPCGANVAIRTADGRATTAKDGVTVAHYCSWEDPIKSMISQVVVDATVKTVEQEGDGTTTCACLLRALYKFGINQLELSRQKGWFGSKGTPLSRFDLIERMKTEVNRIVEELKAMAVKIYDENGVLDLEVLRAVARTSANNDKELGDLVADLVATVGKDGLIMHAIGNDGEVRSELQSGYFFNSGALTDAFLNGKPRIDAANPYLVFADSEIEDVQDLAHIWDFYNQTKQDGPLVLVISNMIGDPLAGLIATNRAKNNVVVIKAPELGPNRMNILRDLAAISGCEVYGKADGILLDEFNGNFGRVDRIIIDMEKTTLFYDESKVEDAVKERVELIKEQLKTTKAPDLLQARLSKLSHGVGIIHVGRGTDIEKKNTQMLIDDSYKACFSAMRGGIIPGGGQALIDVGSEYMMDVLKAPMRKLLWNRFEDVVKVEAIVNDSRFYNIKTGEFGDVHEMQVYDPANVTISALKNAMSAAAELISMSHIIIVKDE